jgi:hypothetical protein
MTPDQLYSGSLIFLSASPTLKLAGFAAATLGRAHSHRQDGPKVHVDVG